MELDTATFFLIILQGFGFLWSFCKTIGKPRFESDFEYLAFSAFWGVALFGFWDSISKNMDSYHNLLQNSYVAGWALAILSGAIGFLLAEILLLLDILKKRLSNH